MCVVHRLFWMDRFIKRQNSNNIQRYMRAIRRMIMIMLLISLLFPFDVVLGFSTSSMPSSRTTTIKRRNHHDKNTAIQQSTMTTTTLFMDSSSSSKSPSTSASVNNNNNNNNNNNDIKNDKVNKNKIGLASDNFLKEYYNSDISDYNLPPSLSIIRRNLLQLGGHGQASDIRGTFVATPSMARMTKLAHLIGQTTTKIPALTPFAAHCLGYAFATLIKQEQSMEEEIVICIGRDPREHGTVLADAFSRGASGVPQVKVVYTGIATTPALYEFCKLGKCHGGVMVTASHLPADRNGFKFFSKQGGGYTKQHISQLIELAQQHSQVWFDMGTLPSTSGNSGGVYCNEYVHWMPYYEEKLQQSLWHQINTNDDIGHGLPLAGINIVLNAGNGSGGFFYHVLEDLGAIVDGSIHINPDPTFPNGIPNPEYNQMMEETITACEIAHADIGILLDTDADRVAMVAPRTYEAYTTKDNEKMYRPTNYEPINRNRLIAMLGVIIAKQAPNCTIVTDSVTSNGLTKFLQNDLGLQQVRFLRGYANVIQKAKLLNNEQSINAEVAIETSGHCALKENDFLDDGTYTAVKILGLLAQERKKQQSAAMHHHGIDGDNTSEQQQTIKSLLDLIDSLEELDEVVEFRLPVVDETLETMYELFDFVALEIEAICGDHDDWEVDLDNLEGIRVSTVNDGGFFLLRKSLHDPVMCLQVEASSKEAAKKLFVDPLLKVLQSEERIMKTLDLTALTDY